MLPASDPHPTPLPLDSAARIDSRLRLMDHLGALRVRWSIGRHRYRVSPGLYSIGTPDRNSPVLVTANYKLSFDRLRGELNGVDAWILVLDTNGINVWCAAGKGTFGTDELVRRLAAARMAERVTHRTLVLPQLGAPGISAHEVQRQSGFRVVHGPVRAADLPAFLASGMKADRAMRTVRFGLKDRLTVVPVELVGAGRWLLLFLGLLAWYRLFRGSGDLSTSLRDLAPFAVAVLVGGVGVPILLPWLPARSFAAKGWMLGVVGTLLFAWGSSALSGPRLLALLLIMPAVSAFVSLNFTGASTYTSLSGVKWETRRSLPLIVISLLAGIVVRVAWS